MEKKEMRAQRPLELEEKMFRVYDVITSIINEVGAFSRERMGFSPDKEHERQRIAEIRRRLLDYRESCWKLANMEGADSLLIFETFESFPPKGPDDTLKVKLSYEGMKAAIQEDEIISQELRNELLDLLHEQRRYYQ